MTSAAAPEPTRFVLVPAAYVYLLRETDATTEVLLGLRRNTGFRDGYWAAAIAGHIERDETAFDAAQREGGEEIGVRNLDLHFEFTMQRTAHDLPIDERVDFFFSARTWTGEPRIIEPHKCADQRWWPIDRLPENTVPHERFALAHLGGEERYLTFGW